MINNYQKLKTKDKQMIQNSLQICEDQLIADRKKTIKQQHDLTKIEQEDKRVFYHWINWDSKRALYLKNLSVKMDSSSFIPGAKQLTNMWVALKMNQQNLYKMTKYNANDTLSLLMNQLKFDDSTHKQKSQLSTHADQDKNSNNQNTSNTNIKSSKNYILLFIQKHIDRLNLNQIIRGLNKWSIQNYSKMNYFNQLLPHHDHIYSLKYLSKRFQSVINNAFKKGHVDKAVKITNALTKLKATHSSYFVVNSQGLFILNKSMCLTFINNLLTLKRKSN